jgi:anti-anti-sigma regulatory factor
VWWSTSPEADLIDSSGLAVLVALYKRMRGRRPGPGHQRAGPAAEIFKLLRMDKVFLL